MRSGGPDYRPQRVHAPCGCGLGLSVLFLKLGLDLGCLLTVGAGGQAFRPLLAHQIQLVVAPELRSIVCAHHEVHRLAVH